MSRPRRALICAVVLALCVTTLAARPPAQDQREQDKPSSRSSDEVWSDYWASWDEAYDDYEEAMAAWRALILQLHLMLIRNLMPAFASGPGTPTDPPQPPPPPPPNPDVVEIHGDSSSQAPQPVEVIPLSGDGNAPVDEVMEPSPRYAPVMLRRPGTDAPPPFVFFTAAGDGIVEMRVVGPTAPRADSARLLTRGETALVPVEEDVRRRIESFVASMTRRGSGVHVTRVRLRAYCLASARPAARAWTVYVPADRAATAQFAAVPAVRAAAGFAARHGLLKPQGDVDAYERFITQYAIWTRLEQWDEARFTRELLARSREPVSAAHQPWTRETERTLRALVPARWHDIEAVVRAAVRAGTRERSRPRHD